MSGLILAGIGRGISASGDAIGDAMMRQAESDAANQRRAQDRSDDREFRAQQDALYRRPVAETGPGGGGGNRASRAGGSSEFDPTVADAKLLWLRGKTREQEAAIDSGAAYDEKTNVTDGEFGGTTEVTTRHPDWKNKQADDKLTRQRQREEIAFNGQYDDITKGRVNQQQVDLTSAALANPKEAWKAAQAAAAGKGDGAYKGDSSVTRNQFTGETKLTGKGLSEVGENNAQAGAAKAAGGLSGAKSRQVTDGKEPDVMRYRAELMQRERTLTTQLGSMLKDPLVKMDIQNGNPPADYVELKQKLKDVESERGALRTPSNQPTPAKGITQQEYNALKPGAKYTAPDGTTRTKGAK